MPDFLSISLPGWPAPCIATATTAVLTALSAGAFAADVLVVTDSHHPVKPMGGERIIELDQPARIEAELSAGLPTDPGQATALARQRLSGGQGDLQRRMRRAYQGVADAWSLGIAKIPAVVVDRRYVVYGEPDVARAVARIDAYRSGQP
ncbi:TIGR03757 family integrating conjugative element protein [Denitromonas ohlonensis]|uniref:TIGR03757 family integrating conjugative element protein n=2 Tax=Denitromonas TaxID=139331 RepID=A0A558CDA1_9RHOO|nr:TIGR03757 family integrating conjugative element protein [Denitromonas ohlonensis]TVT46753.1 MAG: TIGR03757 family integrating conjugative element protein [Denitromonas halophila]TVO64207.1 TIGR03757 family integrating conjugative element protein [Denitromonas ohlonensis]TVO76108.1 TIGR03757 family integrating conjugative element protein [Denitromonas ohlonensis]TVT66358.1 MAG: TIGR03757 family integrating conjugative element protein [Denitromonas halophila]TVT77496.1 MAG: TIGR03757 family 